MSSPTSSAVRVAIIGGGISGLAAAHRLRQLVPDAQLSLFEASNQLGGILETIERDGFLIERSADNFLTSPPAAVELCRQLGIENELVRTDESRRRASVVRNGRLMQIPEGFYLMSPRKLWPILRSPLLSLRGKIRLLAEPLIPPRPIASFEPNSEPHLRNHEFDESIAAFARRRLGCEVFERIVQPLVAGIYTADPEKLSMAATMPQFVALERDRGSLLVGTLGNRQSPNTKSRTSRFSDEFTDAPRSATGARYSLFVAPIHGMQSIVKALANSLPNDAIQLDANVTNIIQKDGNWHLNPQSETRNPKFLFDALIVATPAQAAAKLLQSVSVPLAAELAAIEYAGCAVVSLGFHRDQIRIQLDGFGFVVPQIERRQIIAASFSSLKYPGRAPSDDVLIRVFIGGALQPALLDLPDADLQRIAIDELTQLLGITGVPLVTDIARWPASMPQYYVGHLARIARIKELTARHPTLALAGNAYQGVGIPQCVASGRSAAEQVVSALSRK